ncbi:MAG: acetoacetate--CoA ligase [Microbacteriaceae bacterium]|nr:acetoacetate--CoA ligase [Microbacteriaceae bacterium]
MAEHELLWDPAVANRPEPRMAQLMEFANRRHDFAFTDYDSLWAWSVRDPDAFWRDVWEFFELGELEADAAVTDGAPMPGTRWFPGSRLNFAGYLLAQGDPDSIAIVGADEAGERRTMTRAELRRDVAALAGRMIERGIVKGDVVAGYIPNIPEAIVGVLATASIGAVWSSVGQDYAWQAAADRIGQLDPRVLIATDGYRFGGAEHDRAEAIAALRSAIPSISLTIVIPRLHANAEYVDDDVLTWDAALTGVPPVHAIDVEFSDPLWVLFTSGTTGLPKGLVHGHGGVLIEAVKQIGLHWDLRDDDLMFWFTSPSWVMWNLLVCSLATGGAIVCFDGSPSYPDVVSLWRMVAALKVTYFGTSPSFLQLTRATDLESAKLDLAALRAIGTTGSPLPVDLHRWARDEFGPIPVWSVSGGTDVVGAFVGGSPLVPVWAGLLSARNLGVAVEAWDENGTPVIGQVGELVVTKPMPSMPLRLWGDDDFSRYRDAYFSTFPGVWRQGDWISVFPNGGVVIHGRSDATLNRNGVRMGSADIYAAAESLPEIVESLVLGVEDGDGGYWMPLFVTLREPGTLDAELVARVRQVIRENASPRHVPDDVFEVTGIPHTKTGKKLEIPLKRIVQGADPATAVNPATVDDQSLIQAFVEHGRRWREGESIGS